MKHIKLEVIANEYQQEELIALFDEYHATGFEQTDEKLIAYFIEDAFPKEDINKIIEGYSSTLVEVEEKNWNEEWETNFQPIIINKFCAIRAEFHPPVSDIEYDIIITPKMSFGTGHHATTYMMIEQMKEIDLRSKRVFDFGTGTGILSILSEKLGASKIVAIDVDDWSIANAQENIEKNQCSKISVILSSQIPAEKFDIILANINRNIILTYLPNLNQCLNENGYLLLSGLLAADEGDIINACLIQKLELVKQAQRSTWISLLFIKG